MTVREIREKYPDPHSARTHWFEGEYCVGGALCKSVYGPDSVGMPQSFFRVLQTVNPRLDETAALNYEAAITEANDDFEFERAWQLLDEALNWKDLGVIR